MSGDSSGKKRYLGLWLPFLPADRWRRESGAPAQAGGAAGRDPLMVFVEKVHGTVHVAAVNALAQANGLRPGMSLADARARYPALHAEPLRHKADVSFLARLAGTATAFTPSVALDEPNGLVLDISGCAHLFDGETGLAQRLLGALRSEGVTGCRLALAPTPDMARALARFARSSPCFADSDAQARALPVAALECSAEDAVALKRAGLKSIRDVADRPSVLFTARFTPEFTVKLARVLGEEDRRITPLRPRPACQAEHRCAEPIAGHEVIEGLLTELAADIAAQLRERGEGGRLFKSTFLRTDGAARHIRIETSQPARDPAVLMRLHRERLNALADPLDCGFGLDLIRLEVLRSEPYEERQTTLDARANNNEQAARLIDQLGARFGRDRVVRLMPCDSHIPERAQLVVPAADATSLAAWTPRTSSRPQRPLFLYPHPHPIETDASDDGEPRNFRWRRLMHRIVHADGPERIADEWWRASSGFGMRDYYRVESATGRRFWIFRAHATSLSPPRWFLQGLFP